MTVHSRRADHTFFGALVASVALAAAAPVDAQPAQTSAPPREAASVRSVSSSSGGSDARPDRYAQPAPGDTLRRASVDDALRDAQAWVLRADSGDDYSTALFAFYLHERYGWRSGALQLYRTAQGIAAEPSAVDWGPMIGAPHPAAPHWTTADPTYSWVPAAALRCAHEAPPTDLSAPIGEMLTAGGYDATHGALAWQWAAELGCPLGQGRDEMLAAMRALIDASHPSWDFGLEARAVYGMLGGELTETDIDGVLAAQRPDGWWGTESNRYHATVLAALVLLHARGDVIRDIPMTYLVPR